MMDILLDNTMENVFWTGITRIGCAGQFSTCFHDKEKPTGRGIVASQTDGGCVVVMIGYRLDRYGTSYKSKPCDSLYNLACIGDLTYSLPEVKVNWAKGKLLKEGKNPAAFSKIVNCENDLHFTCDEDIKYIRGK